jgi:hypothetical protein
LFSSAWRDRRPVDAGLHSCISSRCFCSRQEVRAGDRSAPTGSSERQPRLAFLSTHLPPNLLYFAHTYTVTLRAPRLTVLQQGRVSRDVVVAVHTVLVQLRRRHKVGKPLLKRRVQLREIKHHNPGPLRFVRVQQPHLDSVTISQSGRRSRTVRRCPAWNGGHGG